jgi:uncharacterized protein YkwD
MHTKNARPATPARVAALLLSMLCAAGSGSSPPPAGRPPPGPAGAPGGTGGTAPQARPTPAPTGASADDDLQFCVDETNRYRSSLGLPPLARSPELERCAATAAASDHRSQRPHGHFVETQGCGIAFAENEIPWWPLDYAGGSVRGTITQGLRDMWAEGPGGGHYENMRGRYSQIGCGVFIDGGRITVVQNFR